MMMCLITKVIKHRIFTQLLLTAHADAH